MKYIGHIEAHTGEPPLTRDGWLAYIDDRDDLTRSPLRMGRNPANGQPIELRPPPDAVRLVRDDLDVASFSWGPEEYSVINVLCHVGEREHVIRTAHDIALSLGGVFTEFDDQS